MNGVIPKSIVTAIQNLITDYWAKPPGDRPSFEEMWAG
jgi:hypothetical protein